MASWQFIEMEGDPHFNYKAFLDKSNLVWDKLGPVATDRCCQRWKYGAVWVPFYITTSPMCASKWVVNRYFDNAMLLEKGAGNARDASQVMLVRMEPNTPSTIVQIHRDMLASGRVLLEASKGFTREQIIKQEFSGDATWWDVCLLLAPIMGPNVWNVTLMDMEKKVSKCFWKTPLRHQVPDPEEDDGKMESSKVEAARALVPPTKKKASKKGKSAPVPTRARSVLGRLGREAETTPGLAKCKKYWPKQADRFLRDMKSWLTADKSREEIEKKVTQLHQEASSRNHHANLVQKAKAKEKRAKAKVQRQKDRKEFWGEEFMKTFNRIKTEEEAELEDRPCQGALDEGQEPVQPEAAPSTPVRSGTGPGLERTPSPLSRPIQDLSEQEDLSELEEPAQDVVEKQASGTHSSAQAEPEAEAEAEAEERKHFWEIANLSARHCKFSYLHIC